MDKVRDAFVGLEHIQGKDRIKVHQDSYIRQLFEDLERGELLGAKRTPTSNANGACLMETDVPFSSTARQQAYRSWVQRLAYPAVWTGHFLDGRNPGAVWR